MDNDWINQQLYGSSGPNSAKAMLEQFANMGSGVSSPKPLTARTASAMTPKAAPQYTGQEQAHAEAIDDGKQAPTAAARYLAYKDDPEWKQADSAASSALGGSGGFGAAILDRLTRGYYSSSKANQFQMATSKKNEIEKRYYNQSMLEEAAREKFDTQPSEKKVWDAENRRFNDVYVGSHGTRRLVPTSAPTEDVVTQFGTKETVQRIPGATPMIVDPTKSFGGSEGVDYDIPGFEGGQSEVYRPMAPLGMDPKMSADVREKTTAASENEADTKKALAEAGKAGAETKKIEAETRFVGQREISPGASLVTGGGRVLATAPQTNSQLRGGRDGGEDGGPTFEDELKAVQKIVAGAAGREGLLTDTDTRKIREYMEARGWDMNTRQKKVTGAAPATRFPAGKTTRVTLEDLQ